MRTAIYARVSTESQEARGTIGSQLEALRERVVAEGHELVGEYLDDGYSGARLDRPGLDAMRDAAEAGSFEAVWCLSPDRLSRSFAHQVVALEEMDRFGVKVHFADAPAIDDDPQARLLTQIQGVVAEYERAKIAERHRRGKLFRSRAGEVISGAAPYGYRRVPRTPERPAHVVVYEPEAEVVRRIFDDYVYGRLSMRAITMALTADRIPSPMGKDRWHTSFLGRLLRNEAYVGRLFYNKSEMVPDKRPHRGKVKVARAREEWVEIPCPPILPDDVFEAAQRVSEANARWSPRNLKEEAFLLRGLVSCGPCGVAACARSMRRNTGSALRYYYCSRHDAHRAGGEEHRCKERSIRADALDGYVYETVREALLNPEILLAGEAALAAHEPAPNDEVLAASLARIERKVAAAQTECRRLVDLYQHGGIEMADLDRRRTEVEGRIRALEAQRVALTAEREELAEGNRLAERIADFAQRVEEGIDHLDFAQRQALMRLVVEDVRVAGWYVEIDLRIPLDAGPGTPRRWPPDERPSQECQVKTVCVPPVVAR